MKTNSVHQEPPPVYRVFVSSTYIDMLQYRDSIRDALNKADCIPYGMERFGAVSIPPLDVCFEELGKSQIYICALGMRYGSIDSATGKSFTHLEYEKARDLGLPILAFLVDEDNVSFRKKDFDQGDLGEKLEDFKKEIKDSKEVTVAFFDSPMSLQESVYRSVLGEIKRQGIQQPAGESGQKEDYSDGAKIFSRFVKRPERYKNTETNLRVRMDGMYGGWRLRDEVLKGFGFTPGDALYMNDVFVLGAETVDVDKNIWYVDCIADADAADWIDGNAVTVGTVFEGKFKLAYELVEKGAGSRGTVGAIDAKIANLILIKGLRVINHGTPSVVSKSRSRQFGVDEFLSSGLGTLMNLNGDVE